MAEKPQLEPGDARSPVTDRMCATYDGVLEHDHYAEWEGQETIRFFPDHFISEATAMILLLCVYAVLAIFFPAFLEARANPAITPVGSKPCMMESTCATWRSAAPMRAAISRRSLRCR